ncbi:heme ABC exporter ATP-binding protein CcmA [Sphingomonas sp. SUN019]|nr:heme ABC exporter ATP-binding protein CcmA [Sphingomonas sp. SUN019]
MLFEGLSFTLEPGGSAIVTGPNGVGKSSLIRIAAGLLPPAAGRVERADPPALLTEAAALDPERTLAQALDFWAKIDGVTFARIDEALTDLDLSDLIDIPVRLLSTGQRRRAALARVLASPASLWLLDEPANGLDVAAVERLEALIARHRETGGATLIATHQPIEMADAQAITLHHPHPGEGQGPVSDRLQLGPGLRRGGAGVEAQ